jgi:uncharacterized membrane protein
MENPVVFFFLPLLLGAVYLIIFMTWFDSIDELDILKE